MDKVVAFQSSIWDSAEYEETIKGENFRKLINLCFNRADKFSLHRRGWPGAKAGSIEQALQSYCMGEYLSDVRLRWFDHEVREKCYVYPANSKTRDIFLRYIVHLFGQDVEILSENVYFPEKYNSYIKEESAARERELERLRALAGQLTDEGIGRINQEEFQKVRELWLNVFDEADFGSNMEDPCFFRGDDMFCRIITHESQCLIHVPDQVFGEQIRKLGKWKDVSDCHYLLPLGFLSEGEELIWY